MAIYNDLLSQAAQIRDEANERKNTALRVGTMFVDLIQKLQAKLPATIVDASTIGSVTYNPTTITIKFGTTDDDGTDGEVTLTIKEASLLSAGLMASADKIELRSLRAELNQEVADRDNADVSLSSSIATEIADRKAADDALDKRAKSLENSEILPFLGIHNIADFIADPRSQDAEQAIGNIVFYADLHRFDILLGWDGSTPLFKARSDWQYTRYNQGVNDTASPKPGNYQCSGTIYAAKDKALIRLITEDDQNYIEGRIDEETHNRMEHDSDLERAIAEEITERAAGDAAVADMVRQLIPSALAVEAPRRITLGNLVAQYVVARLEPADTLPNVLFLSDGKAVAVDQTGRLTVVGEGESVVQVVPTMHTSIAKGVRISVERPTLRLYDTRSKLRLTQSGGLLLN